MIRVRIDGRGVVSHARALRGLGWVLAAALISVQAPARAETPEDLVGRLDAAIRQVEAAREHGEPLGDPGTLFPETEDVAGPGGSVRVDHSSLRQEWKSVPGEGDARGEALERLRHRLVAVRAEMTPADSAGGAVAPPPAGWRERLSQVLSRPEFKTRQPDEDWRVRLMQWLRERLGILFPRAAAQTVGGALGGILYVLAGVTLLAVLLILARAALPLLSRDRRTAQAPPPPEPIEAPESLLALAEARTRAGNLRGAAQAIFRWMLLNLHRAGRLDYDPALTNREHLTRLKADAGNRATFERVARQFELVWYGYLPLAPEEFAAFRAECLRLAEARA